MKSSGKHIRSPEILQLVLDNIDDLVAVIDLNGRRVYNSPSYKEVLGEIGELAGTDSFQEIHPEDRDRIRKLFSDTVRTGVGQQAEYRLLHKDGTVHYIESHGNVIRDPSGNPEKIVIISRDVTGSRRAREALQRSEQHFRTFFEHSSDVIIITDDEYTIIHGSPSIARVLGYKPDEYLGKSFTSLLHPEEVSRVFHAFRQAQGSPDVVRSIEHRLQHRLGVWRVFESMCKAVIGEDGAHTLIINARDITERNRAEEFLHETNYALQSLIRTSPLAIIATDLHDKVKIWNKAAERIFGWSEREVIGDTLPLIPNALTPPSRPLPASDVRGNTPAETELQVRRRDGSTIDVGVWTTSLRDANGDEVGTLAMYADISERKHAREALQESERKFKELGELLPQCVFESDNTGRLLFANRYAYEMFGYTLEEFEKGINVFQTISPEDLERARESFQKALNGEDVKGLEYTLARMDGTTFPGIIYTSPIVHQGKTVGLRGIILDITERKSAEKETARLHSAVEQAAEAIVITHTDGTILYVNPAFERITGYRREEALGKKPNIVKSGKHGKAFYERMWSTLLKGEVWSGTITNMRKDGSTYEEEMVISPVRDGSGEIVNYVAVKRDVTHEMEMERQLRQSQKMESLGQLAGGIAHDFNNILGVIGGSLTLLKTRISDSQLHRYIDMGETAANRAADVAKRLLMFSREEQVQLAPLSLADIVDEITKVLGSLIEKTVVISTEVPHDLPLIQGDHGQLYQVLLNLCINARDAILDPASGKTGGSITISAGTLDGQQLRAHFPEASEDRYIRLSVRDTGIGMTEEVRQRIFDPFFTTKPRGKGTGLGLAVVYGIVKSHRGVVRVESQVGNGSVFHIYLPVFKFEPPVSKKRQEESAPRGSETVLVVEDETALRILLTELLQMHGYTVIAATDGIEALEAYKVQQGAISAVISDLGLPRLSGEDLVMKIKELNPSARVIMASGYMEPHQNSKLLLVGVKAFVQKPYQGTDLLKTLRDVLDAAS